MRDLIGLFLGLFYIGLVLGISALLQKRVSKEISRKIVHIGVSLWWLIAMTFFRSAMVAVILPLLFVLVNLGAYRFGWFSSIQREEQEQTPGAIYYAISLTLLSLLFFSAYGQPYVGALGVFAMGFGDGFAAVFGEKFGKRQYAAGRSYVGSSTMFLVTFVSSSLVLFVFTEQNILLPSLLLAVVATIVEAVSPNGLDNLTVPLIVSLCYQVVLLRDMIWMLTLMGLCASLLMVVFSKQKHLLTGGGAVAAFAVGTLFFAFGGWQYWVLLILFFLSSNLISKIRDHFVQTVKHKEGARKAFQVLANSLPALALGTAYYFTKQKLFLTIGLGAIAASTADTWASEIGILSKKDPVSILSFKPIQKGLSGGVSPLGFFASLLGAALIAVLAGVFYSGLNVIDLILIFGCGVFGSIIDSVLGSSLQAKFQCPGQSKLMEHSSANGQMCRLVSGIKWISNDWVNLLTGIAVIATALPIAFIVPI